jgi:hypothetical protein
VNIFGRLRHLRLEIIGGTLDRMGDTADLLGSAGFLLLRNTPRLMLYCIGASGRFLFRLLGRGCDLILDVVAVPSGIGGTRRILGGVHSAVPLARRRVRRAVITEATGLLCFRSVLRADC